MDDNTPAVPQEPDVSSGEGGNAPEGYEQFINEVNNATGRNFKSLDDMKGSLKETFNFVGSMGELKEKAQKFDEQQSTRSEKEVKADITNEYMDKVNAMEFSYQFPEAKGVVGEVEALAKRKGVSMSQAYQDSPALKSVGDKVKAEQEPIAPGVITPSQRLAGGMGGPINVADFNKLSLEDQRKIINKMDLGNSVVGKGSYISTPRNG